MGATDYFAVATKIARDHAQTVRDAQVTGIARELMTEKLSRIDLIEDVLKTHESDDIAQILEGLIFGTPSVEASARLDMLNAIEDAAIAYARSQI